MLDAIGSALGFLTLVGTVAMFAIGVYLDERERKQKKRVIKFNQQHRNVKNT